ncbi:MAG: hypothetical protein QM783_12890 [Phycisphaerales bacterium]
MPPRAPNPTPFAGPPRDLSGAALTRWVIDACTGAEPRGLGFTTAGVSTAEGPPPKDVAVLEAWLREGRHGDMAYLADQFAERLDPQRVLPGAERGDGRRSVSPS